MRILRLGRGMIGERIQFCWVICGFANSDVWLWNSIGFCERRCKMRILFASLLDSARTFAL